MNSIEEITSRSKQAELDSLEVFDGVDQLGEGERYKYPC